MRVRPKCGECNNKPADVEKGNGTYLCAKCEMANIYRSMSAADKKLIKSSLWSTIVTAANRNKP